MAQRFLIVTKDEYGGVFVVGTKSGTYFRKEDRADKTAAQINDRHPTLQALVVPVMGFDVLEGIYETNEDGGNL